MLAATITGPLGDFRTDFVNTAGIIIGRDRAGRLIDDAAGYIRSQAAAGVAASPDVAKKVGAAATVAVKPYVYAALGLGAFGVLLGLVAIARTRRRS